MDEPGLTNEAWWRHAAVYQIYVRSFADGNGDGTGDLAGLRSRLGYLRDLGVDAIWVNPWYRSPLADGGYDVADYREIDPRFGSVADAEVVIAAAHEHGLRVLADIVPNHTSVEHAWFAEAVRSPPGHPSRDRYHIRAGKGRGGAQPPTNWRSVFGGPAWTRLPDGEWYLHLFGTSQPDLNWTNPEVREEFNAVLRFWLDRGVDGFRVDVAHGIAKDMSYPDVTDTGELLEVTAVADHPHWDRDDIHEIVREWHRVLDEYTDRDGRARMMVAEAWVTDQERIARYLRADEYQQSFDFLFLETPWDAAAMHRAITESYSASSSVGSTTTWVLSNHDVVRHTTRFGLPPGTNWRTWLLDGPHGALDADAGLRRARAATLLMLALPGAAYLYQGEELGLPEVWDLPVEVLDDPVWEQSGHTRKGRDGCRVPLPWTRGGTSFGFGTGASWLPQPTAWGELSVEAQQGAEGSTLELYRAALRVRRDLLVADEELTWLDAPRGALAFARGSGVQCWVNFTADPLELPAGEVLLRSDGHRDGRLDPGTAVWLRAAR
jgi:alpha-glucosidase